MKRNHVRLSPLRTDPRTDAEQAVADILRPFLTEPDPWNYGSRTVVVRSIVENALADIGASGPGDCPLCDR